MTRPTDETDAGSHGARRLPLGLDRNSALIAVAILMTAMTMEATRRYQPLYIQELGASPYVVGLLVGFQDFSRLAFLLLAGPLADRLAPRLMIGMRATMLIHSLFYIIARSWIWLIPGFIAVGIGNLPWSTISRVIDSSGPDGRDRRFMFIYSIGPSAATLIGPILGSLVAGGYGLREVFILGLVFQVVSVGFFLAVKPTRLPPPAGRSGASYVETLRNPPTRLISLLNLAIAFAIAVGFALAPNYLHNERGISYGLIGAFGSLVAIGSIGAGLLQTRVNWFSSSLRGLVVTIATLPLCYGLLLFGQSATAYGAAFLIWGFAIVSQQTFYGAIGAYTPERLRGRGFALFEITAAGGSMVAGFVAGALYAADPTAPLWGGLVVAVATVLLVAAGRRYLLAAHVRQVAIAAGEAANIAGASETDVGAESGSER